MFEQKFFQKSQEINPAGLVEMEKTLFGKLEGKAKIIAKVLALVTFLTVAPVAVKETHAEDKINKSKMEDMESVKERVIAFLGILFNLPDNPDFKIPAQNEMMKKMAAKVLIQNYALERKGISQGRGTSRDMKEAVQELMDNIELYIDKAYGDDNGEVSLDEMNAFRKTLKNNPGWRVLSEMSN